MRIRRLWLVLGLLAIFCGNGWSQSTILDDTTKNLYGPKTTRFILEKDLLQNRDTLYMVDSSLNATHQYDMVQRLDNMYQDLGLMGTAIRPIYFQMPTQIGTKLGMNAYQPYVLSPDKIKYFNTRSPFTQAVYGQNTRGNQKIHFRYTRNVNKRFNVGLLYRRENTHKQFAGETTRDLAADHHSLAVHAAYQSKNKRYRLLYHFSHLNQMVLEQGGIVLGEGDTTATGEVRVDSLFGYDLEAAQLGLTARSWQTQNTHHLYHEYKLFKQLQIFHILDLSRQRDDYEDTGVNTGSNRNFYNSFATGDEVFVYDSTLTSEGFKYRIFDNMAGVKGNVGPIYYQGYARARQYKLEHQREGQIEGTEIRATDNIIINGVTIPQFTVDSIPTRINTQNTELFLGGAFGINFNKFSRLFATAEYALTSRSDYRLAVAFESRGLVARLKSSFTTPTLTQQRFASNHYNWNNSFNNMLANEASISYDIKTPWFIARPFGSYTLINDYIYFNDKALPVQAPDVVQIASGGVDFHVRWRSLNMRTKAIFSQYLGDVEYLRVPQIFVNSRIYCEDCLLTKLMHTQIGFEVHYKSAYKADGYMPVSKQFYWQDKLLSPAYALVDFFFNVQIGRVRVFLKMTHLNHLFNGDRGYITTPAFTGMRSSFNIGFNWMFFD